MPHSYCSCYIHAVFSTKERRDLIAPELQERLFPYLGGIAKTSAMKALIVGGTTNHVHLLLSLPAVMSIAKAIQLIKGGSSKWIHDTFPDFRHFAWQEGYVAFSVSLSQIETVTQYIRHQAEHHKKVSFEEEFVALLKKHQIEYDERYIWG
ncbi:transposase IS200-family protein [Candidatus Vecturithrix granuli]|uniref:Transposase IS200-family protein n=1 Tax=Vecturithrix granuli TaxID=1499967 RepID=A0A081BZU5_VECG1|nr:transposase IS200-family protein [Candidatus Vecturithrix granuli]